MDAEHIDLGFNTDAKQWFIDFRDNRRWVKGYNLVKNSKITLKNVLLDTYAWGDTLRQDITHGRMRLFGHPKVTSSSSDSTLDEVNMSSDGDTVIFKKVVAKDIQIKYNIISMTWSILADGEEYVTKDITGKMSGTFTDIPIRFKTNNCTFLYSWLITLFNTNLEIKPE